MIELELLGANGDSVVMTDARGTRYNIVVDDALRDRKSTRLNSSHW